MVGKKSRNERPRSTLSQVKDLHKRLDLALAQAAIATEISDEVFAVAQAHPVFRELDESKVNQRCRALATDIAKACRRSQIAAEIKGFPFGEVLGALSVISAVFAKKEEEGRGYTSNDLVLHVLLTSSSPHVKLDSLRQTVASLQNVLVESQHFSGVPNQQRQRKSHLNEAICSLIIEAYENLTNKHFPRNFSRSGTDDGSRASSSRTLSLVDEILQVIPGYDRSNSSAALRSALERRDRH